MTANDRKSIKNGWKVGRESGVKPIEIAENWHQRFCMEGGAKKTPNLVLGS